MSLDDLLDDLVKPRAVRVCPDGDRLVALRVADDWGVGFRLHRRGSHRQWNVREVTLRLLDADASITGNDVRELPLGTLLSEARRLATRSADGTRIGLGSQGLAEVLARRDGTFGSSDEALLALAFEYVSLVEAGDRAPSKVLAERFGGTAGTWTNRVGKARSRGFLTEVGRGEAGGALTLQARDRLGLSSR